MATPADFHSTTVTSDYDGDNGTRVGLVSGTPDVDDDVLARFSAVVRVTVPVIFGAIAVLGLVGNLLVIVVVVRNRTMRSTTNTLIVSLAVTDLVFIVICVPLTALSYTEAPWLFGQTVCRLYQNVIHVTAYASVYTLVLMSLDRYLAVVHPIRSMTLRTERNACVLISVVWTLIAVGHIPSFTDFDVFAYTDADGEEKSICINVRLVTPEGTYDRTYALVFYGSFFAFGYLIPLTLVCILYGLMIRRLLFSESASVTRRQRRPAATTARTARNSTVPGGGGCGSGGSETARARRRVTRMVVIVVAIFAACWLPVHVTFIVQFAVPSLETEDGIALLAVKIACTCLAYMNSCVNPILYAFLSENFRKSFRRLVVRVTAICFKISPGSTGLMTAAGVSGRVSMATPSAAFVVGKCGKSEARAAGYGLRRDSEKAEMAVVYRDLLRPEAEGGIEGAVVDANCCNGNTDTSV